MFLSFSSMVLLLKMCDAAKILAVFPTPSISHQVIFRPLTLELARTGHEVTVVTTDPAFPKGQTPGNLTEIDLHDLSYGLWKKALEKNTKGYQDKETELYMLIDFMNEIAEAQLRSTEVQKLLQEPNEYDLIIIEGIVETALIFSHIYKCPLIQVSSLGCMLYNKEAVGIPSHPFLYPTTLSKRSHGVTFWDKLKVFYDYFTDQRIVKGYLIEMEDAMLRRVFGPNVPSMTDLRNNIDMIFLNWHPMWGSNVPVPPNVVYIWGIHEKSKRDLPSDIKTYLDSSKHGVIYMSFGTNTIPSALPDDKIKAFVKVFSELPYDVLWKFDKDEVPGQTKNIKVGKWFPQSDLLRHPKIKLFITQGGLQSTEEAINAGVPLIGVPILGDQWYNVAKYQHFQIGEKLDIATLTEGDVRNAVKTVLENDRYRENIVKLRSVMRDEPQSALERAVWWTEYVLRHKGAKHLRAAGANVSWFQYYEVKLVSIVVSSLIFVIVVVLFCIRIILNKITSPRSKLKKN